MAILQFQNCEILASEVAAIQFNEAPPPNDVPYESFCDVTNVILRSGKTFEHFHEAGKGKAAYQELINAWRSTLGLPQSQTPATPFTKIGS